MVGGRREKGKKQREEGPIRHVSSVRARSIDKSRKRRLWKDRHIALVDPGPASFVTGAQNSVFGEGELEREARGGKGKGEGEGELGLVDRIFSFVSRER